MKIADRNNEKMNKYINKNLKCDDLMKKNKKKIR